MRQPRFATLLHMTLLTAFVLAMCTSSALAAEPRRWGGPPENPTGIPVRQGFHIEWQKAGFRGPDGSTVVAWSDTRTGDRDVYAQLIRPDGSQAWDATGKAIVSYEFRQEDPEVIWVEGGWIIAWIDFRTDTLGDVYAQKIDNNGDPLWDPNGVAVDVFFGGAISEVTLRAVHDGSGGAIIAWEDMRHENADIFAQRISSSGTILWAAPVEVTTLPSYQVGITADNDGNGNMLVAWYEERSAGILEDIYVAKITPDGQLPWGQNGTVVCDAPFRQNSAKLCPDGSGGCYVSWVDHRTGDPNLYIQRMNTNGQAQWAANGIVLCDSAGEQEAVRVSVSESGGVQDGCIVTWMDKRVNNAVSEIYVQKINSAGTMLWAPGGLKVCGNATPDGLGDTRDQPRITSDLSGGLICAWDDTRGTNDPRKYDLYAARVLANGTLGWTGACGVLIETGTNQQSSPLLRMDSGDGVLIIYTDTRTGSQLLRYQNLSLADGAATLDPIQAQLVYGIDGNGDGPESAFMSNRRVGIVWQDTRFGTIGGSALFYQIVEIGDDSVAHFVKEQNGDTLVPDNEGFITYNQADHDVCSDSSGGFFVTFIDNRSGSKRVRLTRVNSAGEIACSRAGNLVFSEAETQDQDKAFCAPDGQGGCYVAWEGYSAMFTLDVFLMRFDANCQPAAGWDVPIRLTVSDDEDEFIEDLVPSTDGCCIATWIQGDLSNNNSDIGGARICPNRDITWNRVVCNAQNAQDKPAVISDGHGGAYFAWADRRTPVRVFDIYAQRILADGSDGWIPNGMIVSADTNSQQDPVLATDSQDNLYIVWNDYRNATFDLYGQKLTPQGVLLWPTSGRIICNAGGDQTDVQLHVEWTDGLYAVWDDYRAYFRSLYGVHINAQDQLTDPHWHADTGGVVCDYYQWQWKPTISDDALGGIICAWEDHRASGKEPLHSIWCNWINDLTVPNITEIHNAAIPTQAALGQNYPNPFNPTTRFTFAIAQTGRVEIAVFNTLGQHVARLADQVMTAGQYELEFDASRLPSGVYFYRLKTGNFTDVKKMTLLR